MFRFTAQVRLIVWTLLALQGCGDDLPPHTTPAEVPEAERCVLDEHTGETRAVSLGARVGGEFRPYVAGETVELVRGLQGGVMITPIVSLQARDDDPERVCVKITSGHLVEAADIPDLNPGISLQTWLERRGDRLQSAQLDDLIAYDPEPLDGAILELTVEVGGPVSGGTQIDLTLAAPSDDTF